MVYEEEENQTIADLVLQEKNFSCCMHIHMEFWRKAIMDYKFGYPRVFCSQS